MADHGCLLIADITGYTGFLNDSELEHAQDSLASLIKLLITHTRPPLAISRLEGDAVISYAIDGSFIQGQVLVDMIEETYVSFRQALEGMVMNTTCTCNACRNISGLDLKFFVHHGEFVRQSLGGHDELVGRDVNMVHRLTKNTITATTGIRAYTAYTQQAIDGLGMTAFAATLTAHRDSYPDVGEIAVFVQDMAPVWQRARERVRQRVKPEDAVLTLQFHLSLPPTLAWDYVNNPTYRAILTGSDSAVLSPAEAGRTGEGAVFVCAHGKATFRHTIVDWHPFEEVTVLGDGFFPRTKGLITCRLDPEGDGTRVTAYLSKSSGPFGLGMLDTLGTRTIGKKIFSKGAQAFVAAVQRDIDAGVIAVGPTPQPPAADAVESAARESLAAHRT